MLLRLLSPSCARESKDISDVIEIIVLFMGPGAPFPVTLPFCKLNFFNLVNAALNVKLTLFLWTLSLTHWGLVTHHIYALVNWFIIDSGNDLVPVWCQAITQTNADFMLNKRLETKCCEIWIKIQEFLFEKFHLRIFNVVCKMSAIVHVSVCLMFISMLKLLYLGIILVPWEKQIWTLRKTNFQLLFPRLSKIFVKIHVS